MSDDDETGRLIPSQEKYEIDERCRNVDRGKSSLLQTIDLGSNVLQRLEEERESLKRLLRTNDRMEKELLTEAKQNLTKLERRAICEQIFVVSVVVLVFLGLCFAIIYSFLPTT